MTTRQASASSAKPPDIAAVVHLMGTQAAQHAEAAGRAEALLRILVQPLLLAHLPDLFKNAKQLRAYELSDGVRSTRDIASAVGVDQKTISDWWRSWRDDYDIVQKAGPRGQFKACYSILDLLVRFGADAQAEPAPAPRAKHPEKP